VNVSSGTCSPGLSWTKSIEPQNGCSSSSSNSRVTCKGCLNAVTSTGASAKLELVNKFCYLGDKLSVDGDADAAVEARIRSG